VATDEISTTIDPYSAAGIETGPAKMKRFYKRNRKQLQNLSALCLNEVLVNKLGYTYSRQ